MNRLLSLLTLASLGAATAFGAVRGDWKLYPAFDNHPVNVFATPNKIYMLAQGQPYSSNSPEYAVHDNYLHGYDPEADELITYTTGNYLSDTSISAALYNPDKRYLFIAYSNGNIDLLYDDNTVRNIPALKLANLNAPKTINSIRFDKERNRVYLATDFGYIILDDDRGVITESRVYNEKLVSMDRVGDKIIVVRGDGTVLWIREGNSAFALSDFTPVNKLTGVLQLFRINDHKLAYSQDWTLATMDVEGDNFSDGKVLIYSHVSPVQYVRDGFYVSTSSLGALFDKDGNYKEIPEIGLEGNTVNGTWDGKTFWSATGRKGLGSYTLADGNPVIVKQHMMPNIPASYICDDMVYSPKYGMLAMNHRVSNNFTSFPVREDVLLSALKNGRWSRLGYPYTNPDCKIQMDHPNGVTIDPNNTDQVWTGSFFHGALRQDLSNPSNIMLLTSATSSQASNPAAKHAFNVNDSPVIGQPKFDAKGNLWFIQFPQGDESSLYIYVWPAAALKAGDTSKIAQEKISLGFKTSYSMTISPLLYPSNQNLVVFTSGRFENEIVIIDTNGTPDNFSDDKIYRKTSKNYSDQDGNSIKNNYSGGIYEDLSTGLCWVKSEVGTFTFQPRSFMQDPSTLNRIKVARNDGTNLADYLLDNVPVNAIASDNHNRKWFGTKGGGIIITSSDGREIEGELNTTNSQIPSDNVYGLCYNPENGSMMVGTDKGLAEFFMSGSASDAGSSSGSEVRVYPNPVRPDYMGWITIENAPDNGIVKIADAAGNLVKELGPAEGGMVRWDGTNSEMKRVRSGVYLILTSSGPGDESLSVKGKILVVN